MKFGGRTELVSEQMQGQIFASRYSVLFALHNRTLRDRRIHARMDEQINEQTSCPNVHHSTGAVQKKMIVLK